MVGVIAASAFTVGLIEGMAEAAALVVKILSGTLGDYFGKRKGLALFGYGLGAPSKPLIAVAPTIGIVLTTRLSACTVSAVIANRSVGPRNG